MFYFNKHYQQTLCNSEENTLCRYPYIDHRQGKFIGRSYLRTQDVLSRTDPDQKEYELIDCSSAVRKLKKYVKEKNYNLRELYETFKLFDKVSGSSKILI